MKLHGFLSDESAIAGTLADINPRSINSYNASADVNFGMGVFVKDGKVANAKNTDGIFVGIAVFHQSEKGKYAAGDTVGVISFGKVYAKLKSDESAVAIGKDAYVTGTGEITSTNTDNTKIGIFASNSMTGTGGDKIAIVDLK